MSLPMAELYADRAIDVERLLALDYADMNRKAIGTLVSDKAVGPYKKEVSERAGRTSDIDSGPPGQTFEGRLGDDSGPRIRPAPSS